MASPTSSGSPAQAGSLAKWPLPCSKLQLRKPSAQRTGEMGVWRLRANTQRPNELPTSCSGMVEVSVATALFGIWGHSLADY